MSATSLDIKMTDSLERELIARAVADEAYRAPRIGAAVRRVASALHFAVSATLEGIKAARPTAAKGEW